MLNIKHYYYLYALCHIYIYLQPPNLLKCIKVCDLNVLQQSSVKNQYRHQPVCCSGSSFFILQTSESLMLSFSSNMSCRSQLFLLD